MRAAIFTSTLTSPQSFLHVEDVPRPQLEPGHVLLRVVACGVCRTKHASPMCGGCPHGTRTSRSRAISLLSRLFVIGGMFAFLSKLTLRALHRVAEPPWQY
jgi:hypothetical protein